MNLDETKALIEMLRASGITHYKTSEIELNIGSAPVSVQPVIQLDALENEKPIPHVVQELTSLLKLSDVDLVDRLFPDTQKEDGEESAIDEAN